MAKHIPRFEDNSITVDMIPSLTDADLISMGVDKLGERKIILAAVEKQKKPKPKRVDSGSYADLEGSEPEVGWSYRGRSGAWFLFGIVLQGIGFATGISLSAASDVGVGIVGSLIVAFGIAIGLAQRSYALVLFGAFDVYLIAGFFIDTEFMR